MAYIPERISQADQALIDANTGAVVGFRSGRGNGPDMLPPAVVYANGLPSGLIDAFGNSISVGGVPIIVTANASPAVVGTTLTAVMQTGYTVTNPQWVRDTGSGPVAISGATNLTYQLQAADFAPAGSVIQYRVYLTGVLTNVTSAPFTVPNAPATGTTFGPYAANSVISRNGNLIVTTGDNFDGPLDIIGPGTPYGKRSTTDVYRGINGGGVTFGPRGTNSPTLPSTAGYDTDPAHTGYNDANRGVPPSSWSDIIVQAGSKIMLKSRAASAPEQALTTVNPLPILSAGINSLHSLWVTAPFYWEVSEAFSSQHPGGLHSTFWMDQIDFSSAHSYTGLEADWESTSQQTQKNSYLWTGTTNSTNSPDPAPVAADFTNTPYQRALQIWVDGNGNTQLTHWENGVAKRTTPYTSYDFTKPTYSLNTNHVLTQNASPDNYVAANWTAAGSAGAVTTIDYEMIATPTGIVYTAPLVAPINIDFGQASQVIQLDTAANIWGGGVTSDLLICVPLESNEPSGNYFGMYRGLPTGIAYNTSTNALTVNGAIMTRPGRLTLLRGTNVQGSACIPQRIIINVGPTIADPITNAQITTLPVYTKGAAFTYDLYHYCDVGVLTTDANGNKAKTIVVSGLPAGFSYSDTTGLITGTSSLDFNKSVSVTVTNNVGQSVTKLLGFSTTAAATANETAVLPVIQGSPVFRNAYVPNDSSLVTLGAATPPQINTMAPISGGTVTLANASTTTSPTRELLTMPNGNQVYAAHFTGASSQFLSANGLTLTPGGSLVVVYAASVAGQNNTILERTLNASNTTTNREQIMTLAAGVSARRCDSTGSGFIDAETVSQRNTTGVHVALGVYPTGDVTGGGKVVSMNFDGVALAITAAVAGNISSLDTMNMGARIGAGTTNLPLNGYVIAAYDLSTELTAPQREEFMVYLNAKYGIVNLA